MKECNRKGLCKDNKRELLEDPGRWKRSTKCVIRHHMAINVTNLRLRLLGIRCAFLNAERCKVFLPVQFPSSLRNLNVELQYERIIKAKNNNPTKSAIINFRSFIFFIASAGNHNTFLGSQ